MDIPAPFAHFFTSTTLLTRFCDQNGWMDEDSLIVVLLEQNGAESIFEVRFEEILKEGSGCECGRNQCWGKIRLVQTENGDIRDARIIAGIK